jgi:hypothetical protein
MLECVAVHEAGHAVAVHRLGHGVIEARLTGTGGYVLADCDYRTTLPTQDLYSAVELVNAARPDIVATLAGPAAEARHLRLDSLRHCWTSSSCDVARVDTWLRQVVPNDHESAVAWLVEHACWLVDQEWPAIERVAEALLERRALTGDEVAELA